MNAIASLQPQCPYCESLMVWSVELLEALQKEQREDNVFHQAILEAIKGSNGHNKVIHIEDIPFCIWLADEPPSIFIEGWCPKCRRMSAPVFSLEQLFRLIKDQSSDRKGVL